MQRYYGKAGQQTNNNHNNNHNEDVPHVYRTADVAYRSMLKATTQRNRWESDNILGDLADQSILVSGERYVWFPFSDIIWKSSIKMDL